MRWTWRSRFTVMKDAGAVVLRFLFGAAIVSVGVPLTYMAFRGALESLSRLWDPAFDGSVSDALADTSVSMLLAFMFLGGCILLLRGLWSTTRDEMGDVRRDIRERHEMAERAASQAGDLSMSVMSEGGELTEAAESGGVTIDAESGSGLDEVEAESVEREEAGCW